MRQISKNFQEILTPTFSLNLTKYSASYITVYQRGNRCYRIQHGNLTEFTSAKSFNLFVCRC